MNLLGTLLLGSLLLQAKPPVSPVVRESEHGWCVAGRISRPEGTRLEIVLTPVERRWDGRRGRLVEAPSAAARLSGRTVVKEGAYEAHLRRGPQGLYALSIAEAGKEIHSARLLLGRPEDAVKALGRHAKLLEGVAERMSRSLDQLRAIVESGKPGPARARKGFLKGVAADLQILEEGSLKAGLGATVAALREVGTHLQTAHVWEVDAEDGGDEGEVVAGPFMTPGMGVADVAALLSSTRRILSAELHVGVGTAVEALAAGSEDPRRRGFKEITSTVQEALKVLGASEDHKDIDAALRAFEGVREEAIPALRASLRTALDALVAAP